MPNRANRQPVKRATFLQEVKPQLIHLPSGPSGPLAHLPKPQLNSSHQPIRTGPSLLSWEKRTSPVIWELLWFFQAAANEAELSRPTHSCLRLVLAAGPET